MFICANSRLFRSPGATTCSPRASGGLSHELEVTPPSSALLPASPILYRTVSSSLQDHHDFRNLVNFIDNYFGAKLALYDDYVHARRPKVSFENLWMLFDVGDIVYSASKKEGYKSK